MLIHEEQEYSRLFFVMHFIIGDFCLFTKNRNIPGCFLSCSRDFRECSQTFSYTRMTTYNTRTQQLAPCYATTLSVLVVVVVVVVVVAVVVIVVVVMVVAVVVVVVLVVRSSERSNRSEVVEVLLQLLLRPRR